MLLNPDKEKAQFILVYLGNSFIKKSNVKLNVGRMKGNNRQHLAIIIKTRLLLPKVSNFRFGDEFLKKLV